MIKSLLILLIVLVNDTELSLQRAKYSMLSNIALKKAKEKIIVKEIKPEPINEDPQEAKEEDPKPKPINNIFNDFGTAFNKAIEEKKNLIIWVNCFDEEIYKLTPNYIHLKTNDFYGSETKIVLYNYNEGSLYLVTSTIYTNIIRDLIKQETK